MSVTQDEFEGGFCREEHGLLFSLRLALMSSTDTNAMRIPQVKNVLTSIEAYVANGVRTLSFDLAFCGFTGYVYADCLEQRRKHAIATLHINHHGEAHCYRVRPIKLRREQVHTCDRRDDYRIKKERLSGVQHIDVLGSLSHRLRRTGTTKEVL